MAYPSKSIQRLPIRDIKSQNHHIRPQRRPMLVRIGSVVDFQSKRFSGKTDIVDKRLVTVAQKIDLVWYWICDIRVVAVIQWSHWASLKASVLLFSFFLFWLSHDDRDWNTHERNVDFPHPASPTSSMVTAALSLFAGSAFDMSAIVS